MTTRAQVVSEARLWLGTRWCHQASLRGVGTDCIGLLVGVARALGIEGGAEFAADHGIKGYGRAPRVDLALAACERYLDPCENPVAGDIMYLRVHGSPYPHHFALLSSSDYMIHSWAQMRKVVENRIDTVWRSRIFRTYSYRGVV